MLISHLHRIIFVKTRKTAGTSVEISLSRYMGNCDIITPITPNDENTRAQVGRVAQNFLLSRRNAPYLKDSMHQAKVFWRLYNHMPIDETGQAVGWDLCRKYTVFTVERDPYDQVVSHYNFTNNFLIRRGERPYSSVTGFLSDVRYTNADLYFIDGAPAVNLVIPYENLKQGLTETLHQVGVSFDGWLPRAKSGTRPDSIHKVKLSEEDCEMIRWMYHREFEALSEQSQTKLSEREQGNFTNTEFNRA